MKTDGITRQWYLDAKDKDTSPSFLHSIPLIPEIPRGHVKYPSCW